MVKRVKLPDGSIGEFPDSMGDDAIAGVLRKQFPAPAGASGAAGGGSPAPSGAGAPRGYSGPAGSGASRPDLAEDMPWYEKVLVGAGGGMRNLYLGGKELIGQGTETERQERQDWQKNKEDLGGWGTAGEVLGEGVATLPIGGAVGSAGKVLSKAVPLLSKAPAWMGLAGRGAAEGSATNVLGGPAQNSVGENATQGATTGAVAGVALPAVVKGLGKLGGAAYRELMPTSGAASARGVNALERTLGAEKVAQLADEVGNANPSILPRTTAAKAGDARLGALERGARGRGNVDFAPLDEKVARTAWDKLSGLTDDATNVEALRQGTSDIMAQGKDLMDKLPLSQKNRELISKELLDLRNSNEIIANPNLAKEVDNVIASLDNPDATLGVLPQLYWRLGQEAGGSTAIQKARGILKNVADERSGGQFTNINEGYGKTMDQLTAAETAARLRGKFMENGIPTTGQYYGEAATAGAVPKLEGAPLRRALATEARKGNVDLMDPAKIQEMGTLADQLRAHEIYKPSMSSGGTGVGLGESEGLASAALNAGPLWRLRGALGSVFKGLNEQSQKAVDQALLDPDKFLSMVETKKLRKEMLAPWEAKLDEVLRGTVRSTAIQEGE